MPFYDNEILIRNINDLMRNNGMTQVQLAEILGMSQSNVSKALSPKDKKSFTLDQVAGIAQHFKVSVDSLLGLQSTTLDPKNKADIARFISAILSINVAKYKLISVEEEVFVSEDNYYSFKPSKKVNQYLAVYFSNYYDVPVPKYDVDDEAFAEYDLACQCGNESNNQRLNEFLQRFIKILDIYLSDGLDRETFDKIVDSYVKQIDEE